MIGFWNGISISIYQTDLIKSLAIFYLIVFSNFVTNLFTCYQKRVITNNKPLQYFIGFCLFYFLVTIDLVTIPPIQKLLYTIVNYLFFIITTRLNMKIMLSVLFLIFILYFIEMNKKYYLKDNNIQDHNNTDKKMYDDHRNYWITTDYPIKLRIFRVEKAQFIVLDKIEQITYGLILLLVVVGLISYRGELKDQFKKNKHINWIVLFEDTKICNLSDRKSFLYYFKLGLGLKP